MSLNADRPQARRGDQWRFAAHDRLREARFEERRRVVEVGARRIVCELESTDPGAASANLFVRHEQRITGPDRAPARDVLLELLAYDLAA